jgi:ferredoxin-NADP reductase
MLLQSREGEASSGNAGLTELSPTAPAWPGFRPFRVLKKSPESDDVMSLELGPMDGKPLAAFLPGQFLVLRLMPRSTPPLMRSYSLSDKPTATHYRISVKRELHGAASRYVSEELNVGDILQTSAPRGAFTLLPGEAPLVLLSAGIGVTPVLAMLHALAAEGSTREIWWLHGARNGRENPFAQEVRGLFRSLPNCHSLICYSSPDPSDQPGTDFDAHCRLDVPTLKKLDFPRKGNFYLCGPSRFMSDLTEGLLHLGVEPSRIRTEVFGAGASMTPGITTTPHRSPHAPDGSPGDGPVVSFARSGLTVSWDTKFHSLLDLAEACDVPARWSCRTGVCHTCETGIISGSVSYQPCPIDDAADGNLLLCCSRPMADIVIDL